jgi:ferredoxin
MFNRTTSKDLSTHRGGAEDAELEKFEFRNSNCEIFLCELCVSAVKEGFHRVKALSEQSQKSLKDQGKIKEQRRALNILLAQIDLIRQHVRNIFLFRIF